jgi:ATP-binding cassette subfamily B protein
MDRILVFDQGRIVEEGPHETLLREPHDHHRRLFEHQSGGISADLFAGETASSASAAAMQA